MAIAIDVSEYRPGRELPGAAYSGLVGDILEMPTSQIPIETIAAFHAAKIEVAPTIAIDVTGGHTGSSEAELASGAAFPRQHISK